MAKSVIYLKKYNNYFNRTVKIDGIGTLTALGSYLVKVPSDETHTDEWIQFNPNDGIDTELILNVSDDIVDTADYLVEWQSNTKFTRWFVLDAVRLRLDQYKLTLHRDVLADFYDDYKEAPAMIERAKPKSTSDPTIFNLEGNSYNQVKQSQVSIQDATALPWLVGYINKKYGGGKLLYADIAGTYQNLFADYPFKNLLNGPVQYIGFEYAGRFTLDVYVNGTDNTGVHDENRYKWFYLPMTFSNDAFGFSSLASSTFKSGGSARNAGRNSTFHFNDNSDTVTSTDANTLQAAFATQLGNNKAEMLRTINSALGAISYYDYLAMYAENNKIYFDDATQKYYKIQVTLQERTLGVAIDNNATIRNSLFNVLQSANDGSTPVGSLSSGGNIIAFYATVMGEDMPRYVDCNEAVNYSINITSIYGATITATEYTPTNSITISSGRNHTTDAPYDIICMPYGTFNSTNTAAISMQAMTQIISQLSGSGYMYDAQLVPYCPVSNSGPSGGTEHQSFDYIVSNGSNVGKLYYVTSATRQQEITLGTALSIGSTILDRKKQNECELYRLCSPNWAGIYEFNVARNLAAITKVKVSQTLKPFNPYIRVCPVFNSSGLYKNHDNDATGLILGGDFSLPLLNDQWATYELQNKNYQNSFDRSIKSLDVQQDVARREQTWNAIAGVVGAGAGGAYAGSRMGGGSTAGTIAGAVTGAVVGAGVSAIGAQLDWENQEKLRKDARSASIDQFNYQLGNIRALPDTLTRVGAYNVDNKYFVQLEKYDATSDEKTWLENLLTNQGYKIGVVSDIKTYKNAGSTYIQGRFVKIPDLEGDSHMAVTIANEFKKGAFFV